MRTSPTGRKWRRSSSMRLGWSVNSSRSFPDTIADAIRQSREWDRAMADLKRVKGIHEVLEEMRKDRDLAQLFDLAPSPRRALSPEDFVPRHTARTQNWPLLAQIAIRLCGSNSSSRQD